MHPDPSALTRSQDSFIKKFIMSAEQAGVTGSVCMQPDPKRNDEDAISCSDNLPTLFIVPACMELKTAPACADEDEKAY